LAEFREIIMPFKNTPGGLIQAFHAVQKKVNYLPEDAIIDAAEVFGIPVKEAYGVATFYSYFSIKPRGKYIIRICESAPCHVAGAAEIIAALEQELGIRTGETTGDGKFTIELTECVGQCQATPVITVNGKPYVGVTPQQVAEILAEYE
jgi:NADH-quinone oxidoreductase subunit E